MAYTSIFRVTHDKVASALGALGRIQGANSAQAREVCLRIAELFERIAAGMEPATVDVMLGGTASVSATGTLTISSGSGTVGGTIGGTAVTVTWATSDTATAAALVTAINADTTVNKLVRASSAAGVVTLTSNAEAVVANKITLVASGTGVTASAATLTGGAGEDLPTTSYTRS